MTKRKDGHIEYNNKTKDLLFEATKEKNCKVCGQYLDMTDKENMCKECE